MRLLALETSEYVSSLALLADDLVMFEQTFESRMNLCETLAGRVAEALAAAGGELDALAVSLGPGSFTGLRVGLATAKALAHARSWPLVGICTQEAIALEAGGRPGDLLCVVQSARQGHLHAGIWERTEGSVRPRSGLQVVEAAQLGSMLTPAVVAVVGPATDAVLASGVQLPPQCQLQTVYPTARAVAWLALPRVATADPDACFSLQPIYLLPSQAERMRQLNVAPGTVPRRRVVVRRASLADLPDIVRIECASFPTPWPEKALREEVTRSHGGLFLVAELDGAVAGYVGAWLYAGEAHIHNVAVDPALRRAGLAEIMLLVMLQQAAQAGADEALLEYRTGNDPAASLYAKLGFKPVGRRKRYYPDTGEDAIVASLADLSAEAQQQALASLRHQWEQRHGYELHVEI